MEFAMATTSVIHVVQIVFKGSGVHFDEQFNEDDVGVTCPHVPTKILVEPAINACSTSTATRVSGSI